MNDGAARHIILCADDYGMAPGISAAIRDLIAKSRINATSAIVVSPNFNGAEAAALRDAAAGRAAIGLHVTLTAPFAPLSDNYAPLRRGAFPSFATTFFLAQSRALQPALLTAEITRQLATFRNAFGRPPDFVDGHQHVHLLPQIRDAFLSAVKTAAPNAWVRQCARAQKTPLFDLKALVLDILSTRFRRLADAAGVRTNPAFSGAYAFRADADYAALFPAFLEGMPDGGVIMCHPGTVDAQLKRLDPITDLRRCEYEFFLGEDFSRLLRQQGIVLAAVAQPQ